MSALKNYMVVPYAKIIPCTQRHLDFSTPFEKVRFVVMNRKEKREYFKISSYDGSYVEADGTRKPVKVYRVQDGIPFNFQFGLRLIKSRKQDGGQPVDLRGVMASFHELPQYGKAAAVFIHPFFKAPKDSYVEPIARGPILFEPVGKEVALSPEDFSNSSMKIQYDLIMNKRMARETMITVEFIPIRTQPEVADEDGFLAFWKEKAQQDQQRHTPLRHHAMLHIKLEVAP